MKQKSIKYIKKFKKKTKFAQKSKKQKNFVCQGKVKRIKREMLSRAMLNELFIIITIFFLLRCYGLASIPYNYNIDDNSLSLVYNRKCSI